jgi:hypothetical protein
MASRLSRAALRQAPCITQVQPTFYRFWLHRKDQSDQHKMLIELEQGGGTTAYFLSDPSELHLRRRPEVVSKAMDHPTGSDGYGVREWLRGVSEKMNTIIQEHHGRRWRAAVEASAPQPHDDDPLEQTAYLARTCFGAELFLAAKPRQQG